MFALRLLVSLSRGPSPDLRPQSHYCKSVDITTEQLIISPLSLFFCLTDYCKVFRIAKCRSAMSYLREQAWSGDPLSTPNYPDSWEMQPSDQAKCHAAPLYINFLFLQVPMLFLLGWDLDYLCKVLL